MWEHYRQVDRQRLSIWVLEEIPFICFSREREQGDSPIQRFRKTGAVPGGSERGMFLFVMVLLRYLATWVGFLCLSCLEQLSGLFLIPKFSPGPKGKDYWIWGSFPLVSPLSVIQNMVCTTGLSGYISAGHSSLLLQTSKILWTFLWTDTNLEVWRRGWNIPYIPYKIMLGILWLAVCWSWVRWIVSHPSRLSTVICNYGV